MKSRVPSPVELNQLCKEYSMLDARLQRDVNFNGYLEHLGLKGNSSMANIMLAIHGKIRKTYNTRSARCKSQCMMVKR